MDMAVKNYPNSMELISLESFSVGTLLNASITILSTASIPCCFNKRSASGFKMVDNTVTLLLFDRLLLSFDDESISSASESSDSSFVFVVDFFDGFDFVDDDLDDRDDPPLIFRHNETLEFLSGLTTTISVGKTVVLMFLICEFDEQDDDDEIGDDVSALLAVIIMFDIDIECFFIIEDLSPV
ncbi:hypothetical protein DERP_011189 [Dermatophagoides pteronyssinus]|uniref:Uncharacterized protein n=1 Tax=Dermatophagoides pteronyssinus TaxID=6956 RepID=A0ABQ8JCD6_DERPT|nr:hypothetical protein DERP_011189 [Dermatophagoides pteronyssinus]